MSEEDEQMVKDVLIQMLSTQEWQLAYDNFVYENCMFFDDEEEHQISQLSIFKNFQKMMANVYDKFFNDLALDDAKLETLQGKVIQQMINQEGNVVDFRQFKVLMDFNVFKAEMSRKNKLLELQALHGLDDDDDEDDDDEENQDLDNEEDDDFGYHELEEQLELENEEEEINLQLAIILSLDKVDQKAVKELQNKKNEISSKLNNVPFTKKTSQEKLPEVKTTLQKSGTDQMGFNQPNEEEEKQQQQFSDQPTQLTPEDIEKKKQEIILRKQQKLREKIQQKAEQETSQPTQQKPQLSKEEIDKRKQQAAAIKKAISKAD